MKEVTIRLIQIWMGMYSMSMSAKLASVVKAGTGTVIVATACAADLSVKVQMDKPSSYSA